MRFTLWLAAAFVAVLGFATPSHAQATRTWVSGVGDDANPCSRTAPCKTFAGAISKTAAVGEINCLDPAGFGAVTITKPITILCDRTGNGGVLVSGTNGIIVNLSAPGNVVLSSLDIEGVGTGLSGIKMIGQGKLTVLNCNIRNFTQAGITLSGPANARAYIVNSFITNSNVGLAVIPASGVANFATLVNTTIDANSSAAVQANGSTAKVTLQNSQLTGSPAAIDTVSTSATIISVGPSNLLTGTGAPTMIQPFQ